MRFFGPYAVVFGLFDPNFFVGVSEVIVNDNLGYPRSYLKNYFFPKFNFLTAIEGYISEEVSKKNLSQIGTLVLEI